MSDAFDGATPPVDPLQLSKLELDDLGMAERFRIRFRGLVFKTPEAGWAAWSPKEKIWATGQAGENMVRQYAHQVARGLWVELKAHKENAPAAGDDIAKAAHDARTKALSAAAKTMGDLKRTSGMINQLASYVEKKLSSFDPDIWRIGVENGSLECGLVGEPVWVAREHGIVTGWVKASEIKEMERDMPRSVGAWTLQQLPDDVVLVGRRDEEEPETIDKLDMKKGLRRGTHSLDYERDFHVVRHGPAHPEHLATRRLAVAYDATAACPKWIEHMQTVLPDGEDREYFQMILGSALAADRSAQCFLLIQNRGGSGTSTTLKVLTKLWGTYRKTCDPRTWLDVGHRSAAEASPDLAALGGDTRLVYCEEPSRSGRLNESLIKQATGGGNPITTRNLHEGLFDYDARFLLILTCNRLPRILGDDDGIWRRVRLIRFRRQFTEAERLARGDVVTDLLAELPGILNWLLRGLEKARLRGLMPPPGMKADIESYRSSSNPFGEWHRLFLARTNDERDRIGFSTLLAAYKEFCESEGFDQREILGTKGFALALDDLQIPSKKSGKRYRLKVRLRTKEEVFGEALEPDS